MAKHSHRRQRQMINGFVENTLTNNIVLAQGMGLCPIIAAGISLKSGVALTVCTAVTLLPLGVIAPLVGQRLPKWLRPAIYVLFASLLLVGAAFLLENYISPELYAHLYLFLPLLAVNTVYVRNIDRAAAVTPMESVAETLGSTVGFGIVICLISLLREMAITGTIWDQPHGYTVYLPEAASPFTAFILVGFLASLLQWSKRRINALFRRKEESV